MTNEEIMAIPGVVGYGEGTEKVIFLYVESKEDLAGLPVVINGQRAVGVVTGIFLPQEKPKEKLAPVEEYMGGE